MLQANDNLIIEAEDPLPDNDNLVIEPLHQPQRLKDLCLKYAVKVVKMELYYDTNDLFVPTQRPTEEETLGKIERFQWRIRRYLDTPKRYWLTLHHPSQPKTVTCLGAFKSWSRWRRR